MANKQDTKVDNDEPLLVPEEPEEGEEDEESVYGADSSTKCNETNSKESPKSEKSVGWPSLVTAIRVAKWMAKAYGYSSKCKSSFTSQDIIHKQVTNISKFSFHFLYSFKTRLLKDQTSKKRIDAKVNIKR